MRLIAVWVVFLMAVGAWLARGLYPSVDWIQGPLSSALYAAAVAALGCAVIVWPDRSGESDATARSWTGLALAGLFLLVPLTLAKQADSAFNKERDALIAQTMQEVRLQARQRALAEMDQVKETLPRDRFSSYEGRIEVAALAAIRQLDSEMKAELDTASARYREALGVAVTRGPDEWIQMRSREQLEAELAEHARLYSATRAFTLAVERFEPTYLARIEALGLKPPADRVAIAELERILQFWEAQQALDLRRLDEALLAAAIRVLTVLMDDWGQWRFSPRDQQVSFDDPGIERAFKEALADLLEAHEAVEALTDANAAQPMAP